MSWARPARSCCSRAPITSSTASAVSSASRWARTAFGSSPGTAEQSADVDDDERVDGGGGIERGADRARPRKLVDVHVRVGWCDEDRRPAVVAGSGPARQQVVAVRRRLLGRGRVRAASRAAGRRRGEARARRRGGRARAAVSASADLRARRARRRIRSRPGIRSRARPRARCPTASELLPARRVSASALARSEPPLSARPLQAPERSLPASGGCRIVSTPSVSSACCVAVVEGEADQPQPVRAQPRAAAGVEAGKLG